MGSVLLDVLKAKPDWLSDRALSHDFSEEIDVSVDDYIKAARRKRAEQVAGRTIVYLDTNVWSELAKVRAGLVRDEGKRKEREALDVQVKHAVDSGRFVFPMGVMTFLELEAFGNSRAFESLMSMVDTMSLGFCVEPFMLTARDELKRLGAGGSSSRSPLEFLCSPIEMIGFPQHGLPPEFFESTDELGYSREGIVKALYDLLTGLSLAQQFQFCREEGLSHWQNVGLAQPLNDEKAGYQQESKPTLRSSMADTTAAFLSAICKTFHYEITPRELNLLGDYLVHYWNDKASHTDFPTLRVLGALSGLMFADANRPFEDDDFADFIAAASALPIASAFYTDRRLVNLWKKDGRLAAHRNTFACEAVNGFDKIARHLATLIDQSRIPHSGPR